jgi:anti-sigma B factor antagonist
VRDGKTVRLALTGELDMSTAETVERELMAAEGSGVERIVVDPSGLAFMDSSGLRVLLAADARCRADGIGRLSFRRGPDHVHRVFQLTGMVARLDFDG